MISENSEGEFISVDERIINLSMISRDIAVREVEKFQEDFLMKYEKWKVEFAHLIEVIYFCISLEFYNLQVNYLYGGYFKNTEFTTERNIPKIKIK